MSRLFYQTLHVDEQNPRIGRDHWFQYEVF
jgi:hypothetical protein